MALESTIEFMNRMQEYQERGKFVEEYTRISEERNITEFIERLQKYERRGRFVEVWDKYSNRIT